MKKTIENIGMSIKEHKLGAIISTGALVLIVGIGSIGVAIATQAQKPANTKALLEQAESNAVVSSEDIESAGDLTDLGTKIETDEGTVVVSRDENGNIVTTLIKGNKSEESNDSQVGHVHNWIAYYASRNVQTGTKYVVDIPGQAAVYRTEVHAVCNSCGGYVDTQEQLHYHRTHGCNGCEHDEGIQVLVTPAVAEQGHYEAVYGTEQYVDYYYCDECGARQ